MSVGISQALDLHIGEEGHQRMDSHFYDRGNLELEQRRAMLVRQLNLSA